MLVMPEWLMTIPKKKKIKLYIPIHKKRRKARRKS